MKYELYPLTGPQKNISQLEQTLTENSNLNTIYSILKFPQNTNVHLLDKALNKLIEINDSLRLHFVKNSFGEWQQYIEDYKYTPIRVIYHNSECIDEIIELEKQNYFSINNGNILKISIIATPFNVFVFYKTHHILSDGWGLTKIADYIKDIYYKLEKNEDLSNYNAPSYIDFIKRENEYLCSSKFEKDSIFWKNYVSNIEPCTILKNENNFDKTAKRFEKEIPSDICEKISNYCTENKISEYSFFLAIVSVYFYHFYNLNNFAIGTPFLNRQKRNKEYEETGLHISTLPLYINIENNVSFLEFATQVNSKNISLYKHGSFPYYNIKKLFNEQKNNNSNLYEIGFSYQVSVSEKGTGELIWLFSGEQNNSITFHLTQLNNKKIFAIDYLTSIFNEVTINKMYNTIFFLMNQIFENFSSKCNNILISNFQLLIPDEIEALEKFNNTGNISKINKNVINYFEEIVDKFANNTALICDNYKLTYTEFNEKVNHLANILIKSNIPSKSPIVLLFDKCFDMIISMFAVLKIGCYYVPILTDENIDRISYILNDCKPACILTHKNYKNLIESFNIKYLNLDDLTEFENCSNLFITNNELNNIKPSDLAYTIYTSGSTGNPKGVQVMHKNILGLIESIKQNPDLIATSLDISMSLLKYSFDASGIDIYSSLLVGGTLLLVSKNDELNPVKILELIEKYSVTRSFLIPKWIENIATTSLNYNFNISSLKLLGTGGEILKPGILKIFLEKQPQLKIVNLYGPTETTMFSTYKIISNEEIENNYTSIGKPITFSRVAIINSQNTFLPTNIEGELVVYEDENSIENIAKGYLNLEQTTNKKFIQIYNPLLKCAVNAYKTGDIAKINNNLELEFVGRKDDIVKVNGGYLVALTEVEKRITNILGNNIESCCVAVPFKNTKAIILFIEKHESSISLTSIKKHLKENITFYMQPKKIIELDHIPRKLSGKIDKQGLIKYALIELEKQKNSIVLPKTNIEKEIYNIIKNLINIEEFSIIDDFLDDLGIDSLALTSIFVALNDYNITMQDLYTYSNVESLSQYIEDNNSGKNCLEVETNNLENAKIQNNCKPFDLSNILITGTTGFLGIHLLHDLLLNKKVKKIYCIIRNKIDSNGQNRLKHMIDFYYNSDKKLLNLIEEKVIILNGDITKPNFNLPNDTYNLLKKSITTVINSAANVKHFAKPNQIRKDNVLSVDNIIDFCENNISLAHISTLSIAGFKETYTYDMVYNENILYIKQGFNNNPYLISKFNAEKHILEAINVKGLNAKIFRLGNIMPRYNDGKFQENCEQNIFIKSLKTLLKLQVVPKELLDLKLEFSPVDECSKSILLLLNSGNNNIFHILNNNEISVSSLINFFEDNGFKFKHVSIKKFIEILSTCSDEYVKQYILGTNLNKFSQELTLNELEKHEFNWPKPNNNYLNYILEICKNNI